MITHRPERVASQEQSLRVATSGLRFAARRRLRDRELAADVNVGRYARSRVWDLIARYLRRHWVLVGAAALLPPGVGAVPVFLLLSGAARWVVAGVAVSSGLWLALGVTVLCSGAPSKMMGLLAEQETAEVLRALKKDGWKLVNGLSLSDRGDIDHLIVGPRGVAVLETKWSADTWPGLGDRSSGSAFMRRRVARSARYVHYRRQDVRALLGSEFPAVPVGAALVLTGPGADDLPAEPVQDGDITVLSRRSLASWIADGETDRLDAASVQRIVDQLSQQARRTIETDFTVRPTIGSVYRRWLLGPAIGIAAVVGALGLVFRLHIWTLDVLAPVSLTGVAVLIRRRDPLRPTAWATGITSGLFVGLLVGGFFVDLIVR